MPVTGRQGIAQEPGMTLTSATLTWMRPICIGSTLFTTVPRYLPKYFSLIVSRSYFSPWRSCRHRRHRRQQPVADEREVLLVLAALQLVGHALHVIEAVEGGAGTPHAD